MTYLSDAGMDEIKAVEDERILRRVDHAVKRAERMLLRPPTVLLSPRGTMDSNDVWRACIKRGWESHRAIRYSVPDPVPELACAYGENVFCDIMADRADLSLLDPPDAWLAMLPQHMLGRRVTACPAKDLKLFRDKRFFKPANDKVFTAGVYESGRDVPLRWVDPECPCLVSEVVSFDFEVRTYCLDRAPVALQQYRLYGDLPEEEVHAQAREFAQTILDLGDGLPSSVVLDVGHVEGGDWVVVEANPLYSSGIYAGVDALVLLDAILRSSGPASLGSELDRPFVRPRAEVG